MQGLHGGCALSLVRLHWHVGSQRKARGFLDPSFELSKKHWPPRWRVLLIPCDVAILAFFASSNKVGNCHMTWHYDWVSLTALTVNIVLAHPLQFSPLTVILIIYCIYFHSETKHCSAICRVHWCHAWSSQFSQYKQKIELKGRKPSQYRLAWYSIISWSRYKKQHLKRHGNHLKPIYLQDMISFCWEVTPGLQP